ncbi:hypothetical protein JIN77_11925 [Verrucomicrobiaceae bacterium R5-34]|nr:hypothetical protein [Verrucomicrobiaceae bacterium R5-34]
MVSPLHFVGANHYRPGVGATLRFLDKNGVLRDYTVATQTNITNDEGENSDLFIGTLNTAITDSDAITYHPYLNYDRELSYYNKSLIVLGKTTRGGAGTIAQITDSPVSNLNTTRVLRFDYLVRSNDEDGCYFETGDSGSPVFVDQNGVAAIVGTNSLLSSVTTPAGTNYLNYSNFIPHYVDKLNVVMESTGYRMTKAIPGSTTLVLSHTPPSTTIRAGHDFTIGLNLGNTGSSMAENVKLENSLSTSYSVSSASGSSWFDESTNTLIAARRASIDTGENTDYSLTLSIPLAGNHTHTVTYRSDQSSEVSESFTIEVMESFLSWSLGLSDPSVTGDDDHDGVSNLLEYVFGGDPAVASRLVAGENISLLPQFQLVGGSYTLSYVRRIDYADRAITYQLTSSSTLAIDSFSDASAMISNTSISAINAEYEQVTLTLAPSGSERVFRIEVTLDE